MAVTQSRKFSLVSQDIGSNTSDIRIVWTSTQEGTSYNNNQLTAWVNIYANGEHVDTLEFSYKLPKNTTVTICDEIVTVPHDDEGECEVEVNFYTETNISAGTINDTQDLTLPTIPRTSSLTVSNGTLGTKMTIGINRKASTFKHRLTFYISEDYKGYIGVEEATDYITGTSVSWTPQIAYSRASTEGTSVSIQLTLNTYTAADEYVGTSEKVITCAIPDSVKPSCSLEIDDATDYEVIYGTPVQGLSKVHFKVTATESYGSPINAYIVDVGGAYFFTSAEGTSLELPVGGMVTVTAKVTDKRGRSGSASKSLNVLAYAAPSVTALSVIRCDEDGVENAQGDFVRVNFSATATDLNGKNSIRYSLKYKPTTEDTYTEVQLDDLNDVNSVDNYAHIFQAADSSSFDVTVTVKDNHKSTSRSTSASTAFTFMDWHPTGTGIAFGKVSEKERTMEIAMHAEIQGTLARMGNQYSSYVPEGNANAASAGFDLMARITILGSYANAPLTFTFTRRNAMYPMTVHFCFQNQDTLDPTIGFRTVDGENYGAYLVKNGAGIWDLYVARGSEYNFITLQSWYMPQYLESRVAVTFPGGYQGGLTPDGSTTIQILPAMAPALLDAVYPVGSIYMAYSWDNDPNMIFGGYWEAITARVLRAASSTDAIGSEGALASGSGRTYVNVAVWRRVS